MCVGWIRGSPVRKIPLSRLTHGSLLVLVRCKIFLLSEKTLFTTEVFHSSVVLNIL